MVQVGKVGEGMVQEGLEVLEVVVVQAVRQEEEKGSTLELNMLDRVGMDRAGKDTDTDMGMGRLVGLVASATCPSVSTQLAFHFH